jgi:hypothetical protein
MTTGITIEARVLGQKRLAPAWRLPIPDERGGSRRLLRDLITQIVLAEVAAFRERQETRRLIQILTPDEIALGIEKGKVDLGERDLDQVVDPQAAVATALQAFEDGLYFVFIDAEQKKALDDEVFLQSVSRVQFVRLTPLAGG